MNCDHILFGYTVLNWPQHYLDHEQNTTINFYVVLRYALTLMEQGKEVKKILLIKNKTITA